MRVALLYRSKEGSSVSKVALLVLALWATPPWLGGSHAAYHALADLPAPNQPSLISPVLAIQSVPGPELPELTLPGRSAPGPFQRDIQQLEVLAGMPEGIRGAARPAEPAKPKPARPQVRKKPVTPVPRSSAPYEERATAPKPSPAGAAWLLGLIYLHGAGTVRDSVLARLWFERAWTLGEPWGAAGMAWCAMDGCGTNPDPASAARWVAQLRSVNIPRSVYLESLLFGHHAQQGQNLLMKAAAAGDVQALIDIGMQEVAQGNLGQALVHFRAAAGRSAIADSNARLVAERLNSERPTGAATTADELLALAQRAHRGEDQVANYSEALRLYQLALSKGSQAAGRMLSLIYARPDPQGQLDVQWMRQLAYADLSAPSPQPRQVQPAQGLNREPTPLTDLLPEIWRQRVTAIAISP